MKTTLTFSNPFRKVACFRNPFLHDHVPNLPVGFEPAKPRKNRLNRIKPHKNHLTLFASGSALDTNHINHLFRKKQGVQPLKKDQLTTSAEILEKGWGRLNWRDWLEGTNGSSESGAGKHRGT
jgi:hypothetical protein